MSPGSPPDDRDPDDVLVARARDGDRAAFECLYRRHAARLATLLAARFPGHVEDLLQEAFLRALTNLDQFEGGNFAGWVFGIARNRAIDEFRRRQPEKLPDLDRHGTGPESEPAQIAIHTEVQLALERCLQELDDRGRALIVSQYGGEEDHVAVCARLGITVKRGYRVRHYALKQLRRCMNWRGG
jgi:RNA polymerase sigma-70 factor (ECF subfamily)